MEYDPEQKTAKMIEKYGRLDGKSVLEVGCGKGKISSYLADNTKEYIAIDPDEQALAQALESYKNVDFRKGSGESLQFDDYTFDRVLFTLSLHHQNSLPALKEAHRVLTDNGCLLVVEPNVHGAFQQFFHLFEDETEAIETAFNNLNHSSFSFDLKHCFLTEAVFENLDDLCTYDFDRDTIDISDNDRIIAFLEKIQPGASKQRPIVLDDRLDLYLLSKN